MGVLSPDVARERLVGVDVARAKNLGEVPCVIRDMYVHKSAGVLAPALEYDLFVRYVYLLFTLQQLSEQLCRQLLRRDLLQLLQSEHLRQQLLLHLQGCKL